jgi:hypothetical protein
VVCFYQQDSIQHGTSGALNAKTTKRGSYSGVLQIGGRRYSFSGQLDPSGSGTTTINRKGENHLTLNLQVEGTDNGSLTGTVTDGAWIADLAASRAVFGRKNPAPAAGKYTLVLPGGPEGNTQIPQGNGFGSVTVNASGQVKLNASLADGTKTVQAGSISEDGQWPVYLPLYQGGGQLLGWMNFTSTSNKHLEGTLNWSKLANDQNDIYPQGFEMNLAARGSAYEVPGKNIPILPFSDGQVVLSGGGLTVDLVNNITIDLKNKITNLDGNNLSLSFTPATGLFKGSIENPEDNKTIAFRGIVLQDENAGFGYFLRNNQSGKGRIVPR